MYGEWRSVERRECEAEEWVVAGADDVLELEKDGDGEDELDDDH